MAKIAVLGAGGWGTALASMLHQHARSVALWARRPEFTQELLERRENRDYLPGVPLPDDLPITSDLQQALDHVSLALIVVPSVGVQELLEQLPRATPIVLCAKGLGAGGERLSLMARNMGFQMVGVLSGPNHAEEVSRGLPAATVVASEDEDFALLAQSFLMTPSFRVYTSTDLVGVELGGVLKNVIAVAAGMVDGLKLGDNAKSALMTRALREMQRYLQAQGAEEDTVFGLSGLGDLIATCTSQHSRNRAAGEKLALGQDPRQGGKAIEGIRSTYLLHEWAQTHQADLPIVEVVYSILENRITFMQGVSILMGRKARSE
ncbi:NAD(P)H-dependent glycerol-3-phosphate dehydrogenase [Deinococcus roseus]|uniref:Glycerol-3-phosphate dehydrogenase [NAD(P)+] n=1 Tax=Deinococcus roseus TaxID=392414 RepID=A0ABQ2D1A4_9DEIO|nr:NAD(P)H-dependent glycerol-3-phosphate dehydrogenase [Deinococcus roseus]GGJ41092.1 glycerol-3-phosphate dehydrogenase [NAD(P)+] [Deinococcus roseus]